jgi:cyclopropane fatty-acyl-phospholipid synthase-like methyltransferase
VLDLGMGEGRNALFFARQGYPVRGIDSAPAAVAKCRERAEALGVEIDAEVGDMLEASIEPRSLALVISTMALQFVKRSESHALLARVIGGLQPGGMLYLVAFSTEDPLVRRRKEIGPEVEPGTYYIQERDTYLHGFAKDELLEVCRDLTLVYLALAEERDEGHPGSPEPHYHGIITYIGRRD